MLEPEQSGESERVQNRFPAFGMPVIAASRVQKAFDEDGVV